jgi:hypothetical protein
MSVQDSTSTPWSLLLQALPKLSFFDKFNTMDLVGHHTGVSPYLTVSELSSLACLNRRFRIINQLNENAIWSGKALEKGCGKAELESLKKRGYLIKNCVRAYIVYEETSAVFSVASKIPSFNTLLAFLSTTKWDNPKKMSYILPAFKSRDALVESLDLSSLGLFRMPTTIVLSHLTSLDLSNNNLRVLPSWICNLPKLSFLNLERNNFSSLPEQIGNLTCLKDLMLSNNHLSFLPESFKDLKLVILDLSNNPLGKVPSQVLKIQSLKFLTLNFTQLTSIPGQKKLGNLQALIQLGITGNKLNGKFPAQLRTLKSLKILYIQHNKFTDINPKTVAWFSTLTRVFDGGNSWTPEAQEQLAKVKKLVARS